jgi:hypothetical protein
MTPYYGFCLNCTNAFKGASDDAARERLFADWQYYGGLLGKGKRVAGEMLKVGVSFLDFFFVLFLLFFTTAVFGKGKFVADEFKMLNVGVNRNTVFVF